MTPQPRIFARTLSDRSYIYQPNTVKSNKPISIGHAYSSVVLFPEEESEHAPVWVVPLSVKRVESSADKELVGAKQIGQLLDDETLPFHVDFCVEVGDSGYSKPEYLIENRPKRIWSQLPVRETPASSIVSRWNWMGKKPLDIRLGMVNALRFQTKRLGLRRMRRQTPR